MLTHFRLPFYRPSTNHASPTGSLPFLLPPRISTSTAPPRPIPADKLLSYAALQQQQQQQQHGPTNPLPASVSSRQNEEASSLPPRAQAYLSLVTSSLRNAWLYALYLDVSYTPLLRRLYVDRASSSGAVRATLLRQLRRAAAEQIALSSAQVVVSSAPPGAHAIDVRAVCDEAREALAALAGLLRESSTGWFFDGERPGEFDAAVFSYTHLMMEWMGPWSDKKAWMTTLGQMVEEAGEGRLAEHRDRMLRLVWPLWDSERRGWNGTDWVVSN
jgi:metaxin